MNDEVRVWVRARAVDGQANTAIEQALAQAFGLRPRQVRIIRGMTSRHKLVELDVADLGEARKLLRQSAPPPDFDI